MPDDHENRPQHDPDEHSHQHDGPRPQPARASEQDRAEARELALTVARGLDEAKCEDIVILGVHEFSQLTDFVVIASGTSERQLRTASHKAMDAASEIDRKPYSREGEHTVGWMVIDFIDVMVHIFEPHTRALYDLEMLWGDAERVPFTPPSRAGARSSTGG